MIQNPEVQANHPAPWSLFEVPIFEGYGSVKRFLDLYKMDDGFRAQFHEDPESIVKRLEIDMTAEELGTFIDPAYVSGPMTGGVPPTDDGRRKAPPAMNAYLDLRRREHEERVRRRDLLGPKHAGLAAWRRRQIARCRLQLPADFFDTIMHGPFAIELSSGCSAGCWFCAVSAEDFNGHFPHRDDEASLYRDILAELHAIQGTAFGREGILYWATDPLDNPDYEHFLDDFIAEFGRAPTTTTSLAAIDVERTRRLLQRISTHPCWIQRFSITKPNDVATLLDALSPEETANVEFLATFSKLQPLTRSGRALDVAARQDARGRKVPEQLLEQESTCACMSGFLVNMVERTVKLVSPHPATSGAIDGYLQFGSRSFTDGDDFRSALRDLADGVGDGYLDSDDVVEPAYGLRLAHDAPNTISATGQSCSFRIEHPAASTALVAMLQNSVPCLEIAMAAGEGRAATEVFDLLNRLYAHGVLLRGDEMETPR